MFIYCSYLIMQNLLPQFSDNVNENESQGVDVVGLDFTPGSIEYSALESLTQMLSTEPEVFF